MNYIKTVFFVFNFILVVLYLYPGSILGCLMYNDCLNQPRIAKDIIVSSNHFFTFLLFSILGIYSYTNKLKELLIYILSLSFFLELLHFLIPNRSFQFQDLFGNMLGTILPLIIFYFVKYRSKQK